MKNFIQWWKTTKLEDLPDWVGITFILTSIITFSGSLIMLNPWIHIIGYPHIIPYIIILIVFGTIGLIVFAFVMNTYDKYDYKIKKFFKQIWSELKDLKVRMKGFETENDRISYYLDKEERV